MGRPSGSSKTGGRVKGTPNKRTLELVDILETAKYNPIRQILSKYQDLSTAEQLKVDLKILEYLYPKPKDQQVIDSSSALDSGSLEGISDDEIKRRKQLYKSILFGNESGLVNALQNALELQPKEVVRATLQRFLENYLK